MTRASVRFLVRTPHHVVFDGHVSSVRVPTESGLVGLRPRSEPAVVPVEPGLVLLRVGDQVTFVASVGGLLHVNGEGITLYTPLGVLGGDAAALRRELDRLLANPSSELVVRARLRRLESRMLTELHTLPWEKSFLTGERS